MKTIYIHHHRTLSSNIFVFFAMTNYRLNLILTILPCTTLELCPFDYFEFAIYYTGGPLIIFNFAIYYTGVMSLWLVSQFCHLLHRSYVLWLFSILPFITQELCPLTIFNFAIYYIGVMSLDHFVLYYTEVMSLFQFCLNCLEFHWNDIFLY